MNIVERTRILKADEEMVTNYIASTLTKEEIENYTVPAYERGFDEGLEKGLEQGLEKARRENAKNLKILGVDIQIISSATGLPPEEIQKL